MNDLAYKGIRALFNMIFCSYRITALILISLLTVLQISCASTHCPNNANCAMVDISTMNPSAIPPKGTRAPDYLFELIGSSQEDVFAVHLQNGVLHVYKTNAKVSDTCKFSSTSTYTTKVSNGTLLGYSGGEWGGGLSWHSIDRSSSHTILEQSIIKLFRLGSTVYAVSREFNKLNQFECHIYKIKYDHQACKWRSVFVRKINQSPCQVLFDSRQGVQLLTTEGIICLDKNMDIQNIYKVNTSLLCQLGVTNMAYDKTSQKYYYGLKRYIAVYDIVNNHLRYYEPF